MVPALWVGLLTGVAFIATPAKFYAALITRPVALDNVEVLDQIRMLGRSRSSGTSTPHPRNPLTGEPTPPPEVRRAVSPDFWTGPSGAPDLGVCPVQRHELDSET